MTSSRPSRTEIPAPVKREVRQRCGFGCVVCGLPLYEYDHVEGWARVHRHVAEEIVLLCDRHHRERTNELLSTQTVLEANKSPHNRRHGVSAPYALHYNGRACEVSIGSNTFTALLSAEQPYVHALVVDGQPLIAFRIEEGNLLLSVRAYNDCNELALEIYENELRYSVTPWDITFEGRSIVVREARARFLLDILLDPPNRLILRRGRFLYNGVELLLAERYVFLSNKCLMWEENKGASSAVGLAVGVGAEQTAAAFIVAQVPRYLMPAHEARRDAMAMLGFQP